MRGLSLVVASGGHSSSRCTGPLTIAASLVAEHRLQSPRLSNCGSRAQLLRGMWDPPRPGLEPVSPALAGRFSTTVPPGKPQIVFFKYHFPVKEPGLLGGVADPRSRARNLQDEPDSKEPHETPRATVPKL